MNTKYIIDVKHKYKIYKSSQNTRHQKRNSFWVVISLGDKICPPEEYGPRYRPYF